jgi:NADH dehydrogenase FAD-containing subunit
VALLRSPRRCRQAPGLFSYLDGEEQLPYDYLILATGAQQSYFGDEFAAFARA